jgi:hypothetical protein
MTSDDQSPERCDALSKQIGPMLGYLGWLSKRMAKAGIPPGDPQSVLICRAEDAMHRLRVDVHYRSVEVRRGGCQAVRG